VAKKLKRQDPVFSSPRQFSDWLVGMGWGAFSGVWLGALAGLLNDNLEWYWALGIVVGSALLGLLKTSRVVLQIGSSAMAAVLALCIFTPILQPLENALDASELPSQADVIVPLGAGFFCGSAELDGASLARLTKGLELWRSGYAKTMTITDAHGLAANCGSIEDAALGVVQKLYPNSAPEIVVLRDMKTTRTEAEAVAREAKSRGWKRILIVTSPSHSRRAKTTFKQLGLDAFVVASSEPRFDSSLRTPFDRLQALRPLAREVAGFVKYALLGWF
jgi:uncharacterized SAM-binding protein YcdF (DUF218 family)